ncbi:hypothetical protein RRG08_009786 [Elysia crispata]|uniref:Uncharacterized protein n=1 Tax=Elysia crispata TaxID=231223 RepID=A0AAE0ZQU4_9GAST|nr:hypothetical protein RRG08_009786 [Elysia crispata]
MTVSRFMTSTFRDLPSASVTEKVTPWPRCVQVLLGSVTPGLEGHTPIRESAPQEDLGGRAMPDLVPSLVFSHSSSLSVP